MVHHVDPLVFHTEPQLRGLRANTPENHEEPADTPAGRPMLFWDRGRGPAGIGAANPRQRGST